MRLTFLLPRALFFAFGCLAAYGAAGDTGNPIAEAVKPHGERSDRAWKRYRNNDLGYCVSYPSRWARGDAFDGSGLFVETGLHRYSKPVGEIDIGPLALEGPEDARLKTTSLAGESLDRDLEEHMDGLRKFARAEKMEILEQRPMKLQGAAALYVKNRYYDPLERSTWMQEVVFVKHSGQLYRLELECKPDQIGRFEAVFAYLVNTFEFDCAK